MKLIEMVSLQALPRELKSTRQRLKLNVRDAAKAAKVGASTLSRVENRFPCDALTYSRISAWILANRVIYRIMPCPVKGNVNKERGA